MAKTINLGKVRFTVDGYYSPSKTYANLCLVTDSEGLKVYSSIKDNNKGHNLGETDWWREILDVTSAVSAAEAKAIKGILRMTEADTNVTLQPGKMYEFPTMTTLSISLSTPPIGELAEWQFSFDSGDTPTTLIVPATISWNLPINIKPRMHYEGNLIYSELAGKYFGILIGWSTV